MREPLTTAGVHVQDAPPPPRVRSPPRRSRPPDPRRDALSPELRRVEALLAMGKAGEAALLAERLPERDTPSVDFLRVRGRAFRAAGRVLDAEANFREALSLSPGDPALSADLATTLAAQHRFKDALPFAREAVELRPGAAAYHALLGFVADRLDYSTEARRALETARELAPADAETHTVLGFHLLRVGEHAPAIEAFEAAISADPRRAEAFHGLSRALLAGGQWQSAVTAWTEALGIDPSRRDRQLDRDLRLKRPGLRPVHRLAGIPAELSLAVALIAAGLLWYGRSENLVGATLAAIFLLCLATLPPAARQLLGAIDG